MSFLRFFRIPYRPACKHHGGVFYCGECVEYGRNLEREAVVLFLGNAGVLDDAARDQLLLRLRR